MTSDSSESKYSPFPWTIQFCEGLNLQYMILDADGDMVAIGEWYDEGDMIAFIRVFMRNPEIRIDNESLSALRDRRQREVIRRELQLEMSRGNPRGTRRKKQRADAGTDPDQ